MEFTPSNLLEAVRYFADLRVCNSYMRSIKWPDGQPCCCKCGSVNVYELSTRPLLKCRGITHGYAYTRPQLIEKYKNVSATYLVTSKRE